MLPKLGQLPVDVMMAADPRFPAKTHYKVRNSLNSSLSASLHMSFMYHANDSVRDWKIDHSLIQTQVNFLYAVPLLALTLSA